MAYTNSVIPMSDLAVSCKIISLFNQAGGVAKTTLAMNLGYQLAQRTHRVLLIDLDPQASLTVFMGLKPFELEATVADSVLRSMPMPIHSDLNSLDLVPANISLSAAEIQLSSSLAREWKLKQAIEPIQDSYDFILIDCPPSLGILSILGLVASTHILVPLETQFKAFMGVELLLDTVNQVRQQVNQGLKIAGFVPTIFASANAQDKQILEAVRTQLSTVGPVFSPIPRATAFADASMARQPLSLYAPKHPAIAVLNEVAQALEVM
jgi:chromosome partitioning protein